MICSKIKLVDYRNVSEAEICFEPGVNFIYGENAEGKTNLLEAVYLFARGRSFRTSHDTELIQHGKNSAAVKIEFSDKNRVQKLELYYDSDGNRRSIKNGIPIYKMSEFIGNFRAVLFCPQMLGIIQDGPAVRRNFLDIAISQIKPVYLSSLQNYKRILNQRNALLKDGENEGFETMMEVFAEQLSEYAEIISRERQNYTEKLNTHLKMYFEDMTNGREKPQLYYESQKSKDDYLKMFTENIKKELKYGISLYGPQKDDLHVSLNGYEAKDFCSQGQQRSLALALKIGEGEISKQVCGEYPVFLFDDIMSELDDKRKFYLLNNLKMRQIIMTSCDNQLAEVQKFYVKNGTYTKIDNR